MKSRLLLFTILLIVLSLGWSACARPEETMLKSIPCRARQLSNSLSRPPCQRQPARSRLPANFLNWYLKFGVNEYGMPLAPFEEGGHHACDCISPEYRSRIDAEVSVAPEQRGTYDPVTNGFGLIDSTNTRLFESEGSFASVIAELEGMDWARQITIDLVYSEQAGWWMMCAALRLIPLKA
jgi:hypothetical protein